MPSRRSRFVQLYVPASSTGMCGTIALATIAALPLDEAKALASLRYQSKSGALSNDDLYGLAVSLLGRLPVVRVGRAGETAEEAARDVRLGIVTTRTEDGRGHAMPVVEGALFNKCGFSNEQADIVMAWEPKRGEIARIVKRWG